MSTNTYIFHVNGMHCAACTLLLEETFKELPNVTAVKASLGNHQVSVTGEFTEAPEVLAENLTKLVKSHGYTISVEKNVHTAAWRDFAYALPIALVFILGFALLQKAGLTNLITGSSVSYGTAFVIVLGGTIGLIGSSFHLGITANVVLGVVVALVMLILGVNLLDVFHFTKRLQITMPAWLS